jgi:glycosyltransferase involved in cell wall biosynthesis
MVGEKGLRVLIIAYLYPPLWEAQSVRWYYLSRELAKAGIQVDVLTVKYPGETQDFPGIKVYRTSPGPFNKMVFKVLSNPSIFSAKVRCSTKFIFIKKLYRTIRKLLKYFMMGDIRNEWFFTGYFQALKLLQKNKYDFLITSHEPIVDTIIGLALKSKLRIKWIADLADPILAPYYPNFWKPILRKIEKKVLEKADLILVTNSFLKKKYAKHAASKDKILIITQGFDLDFLTSKKEISKNGKFTLAYTGSFYKGFREPKFLIEALKRLNFDFEFQLAGRLEDFLSQFEPIKQKVKYLGVLPHQEALKVQANSDVLIYLGNKLDAQVPGKFFEYLGSRRPVLCIVQNKEDPVAKIVRNLGIGEVCSNEPGEIYQVLERFYKLWAGNKIEAVYPYQEVQIKEFSWQNQVQKLLDYLKNL